MSKQYQVKQIETNKRGYKVTRTVSTEDAEEIKALLGLENKPSSNSKKEQFYVSKKWIFTVSKQ